MPTAIAIDDQGYIKWGLPVLNSPLTIDGYAVEIGVEGERAYRASHLPTGVRIEMGDGSHAYQCPLPKAETAASRWARSCQYSLAFSSPTLKHMVRIGERRRGLPAADVPRHVPRGLYGSPMATPGRPSGASSRRIG